MARKSKTYVVDLLGVMAENETNLQFLYEAFSRQDTERAEFWLSLAAAEAAHSRMALSLQERAEQGTLGLVSNSTLKLDACKDELNQLKEYLAEVLEHGISPKRAAVLAHGLEDSLLEKKLHQQFDAAGDDKARTLLERLHFDTEAHRAELETLIVRRDEYNKLVKDGLVTTVQIELARTLGIREHLSTEAILISRFGISKKDILNSLSEFHRLPAFPIAEDFELPADLIDGLRDKYPILKSKAFVPVGWENDTVVVAMGTPGDLMLRDDIPHLLGYKRVELRAALLEDVLGAIDKLNMEQRFTQRSLKSVLTEMEKDIGREAEDAVEAEVTEDDSIIVRLVNLVVEDAHKINASDIHIETDTDGETTVRYRVDGVMRKAMESPRKYGRAIISRVKIMSGLDIAERRKPQSGKIKYKRWGRLDIELRVETYPTAGGGEDAALRLLAGGKARPLAEMGFTIDNLDKIQKLVVEPYGIFLVVGPTGSGKTSTLHSALAHINNDSIKILTAEDPVEIAQAGLRQLQMNPKAGLTFAEALRSFLRADPDVIMIGEMRDQETAGIAIEASLTGHLVFSTLHTNSAAETITRLLDMGINPYSFSDALLGVLAQRLVRTLCPACRKEIKDSKGMLKQLKEEYGDDIAFEKLISGFPAKPVLYEPSACTECGSSGYKGRTAVHELLVMNDDLKLMITRKAPVHEIRKAAMDNGMRSLKQDGIEKVLRGQTTFAEIAAVCSR